MARLSTNFALLAAALLAALALAACGGEDADLLAGETAEEITQNLDRVEELAAEGNCVGAEEATAEVSEQVENLQVDSRLQAALSEGVTRLSEVVAECEEAEEEEEAPETTETVEEPEEEEEAPERDGKERKESEEDQRQPEDEPESEQTTPPSEEEKGKSEEAPPTESESPSGGLGPGEPAGGE